MVKITSPNNGQKVTGKFTVVAEVVQGAMVNKVEFLYDGQIRGSDNSGPYSLEIDPKDLDGEEHTVTAKVILADSTVVETSIKVIAGD